MASSRDCDHKAFCVCGTCGTVLDGSHDALIPAPSAPEGRTLKWDDDGEPVSGGMVGTPEDYRQAPSGIGPHADTWNDKPHRLVYDLAAEVKRLSALLAVSHG